MGGGRGEVSNIQGGNGTVEAHGSQGALENGLVGGEVVETVRGDGGQTQTGGGLGQSVKLQEIGGGVELQLDIQAGGEGVVQALQPEVERAGARRRVTRLGAGQSRGQAAQAAGQAEQTG